MEKWIGDVLADLSPPEKPKFKTPLILVHGLWTGSWCWRPWDTHFSNLGWECWTMNFRGRFEERALEILRQLSFQDCVDDLKQVIRASPSPPVLLAHSMGGLVAQKAAEDEKISGLILLSSISPQNVEVAAPRALRLLRLKYAPLLFLRRPFCLEEKDFRRNWLASLPQSRHPEALRRMVPESSQLVREFFDRHIAIDRGSVRCPVLVVGGSEDRVVPQAALRELARWLGAEICEYPKHGHWIMGEGEGEGIVRDIHRWIVQKLGDDILLPVESGLE